MTAIIFNNQTFTSLVNALFDAYFNGNVAQGAHYPNFWAHYPCSVPRCFSKCSLAMTKLISAQVAKR